MKYIRMHEVEAEPMTRGGYNTFRGWEMPANENAADAGYKVTYPDGYVSWCPKSRFEEDSFSPDGESGCPDENLLEAALRIFHDQHYCSAATNSRIANQLVRAYYEGFVG